MMEAASRFVRLVGSVLRAYRAAQRTSEPLFGSETLREVFAEMQRKFERMHVWADEWEEIGSTTRRRFPCRCTRCGFMMSEHRAELIIDLPARLQPEEWHLCPPEYATEQLEPHR